VNFRGDLLESKSLDLVCFYGARFIIISNLYKLMATHEVVLFLLGGMCNVVKQKV